MQQLRLVCAHNPYYQLKEESAKMKTTKKAIKAASRQSRNSRIDRPDDVGKAADEMGQRRCRRSYPPARLEIHRAGAGR